MAKTYLSKEQVEQRYAANVASGASHQEAVRQVAQPYIPQKPATAMSPEMFKSQYDAARAQGLSEKDAVSYLSRITMLNNHAEPVGNKNRKYWDIINDGKGVFADRSEYDAYMSNHQSPTYWRSGGL